MKKWLLLLALAGCGKVDYSQAPVGRFDGSLFVMWVHDTQDGLGDGEFVFVPSKRPLTFTRSNPRGSVSRIEPEIMYTDGGSIPGVFHALNGFSPWGYAPAYMVHDWLYVARKCLTDGMATTNEAAISKMTFEESADVLAEAIKTLIHERRVADADFAPEAIASATAGPIARNLWKEEGKCANIRVRPEHLAEIQRALPGVIDLQGVLPPDAGPKAVIVAEISF